MVKKRAKKGSKGDECKNWSMSNSPCGCGGCAYILGVIGAAWYYLTVTSGFWAGVVGLLKALVWPGFLVYEVLKFVGA